MFCVKRYTQEYIDECRRKVNLLLATYKNLVNLVESHEAIESFENVFFNNMVLVLDAFFSNRSGAIEEKDGNAINEVRVLCDSILNNKNIMLADKTITLDPEKSVLKHKAGDEIRLGAVDFMQLSNDFFWEIEKKYCTIAP